MGVDRGKVDDALDVTDLPESAVYDIEERAYVRKADVDDEHKQTRLQGLKDRLTESDDPEVTQLCEEVETLERRIEELIGSTPGTVVGSRS